jgi:sulfur relay (sulfurtransferase) complex TusBCD TusD component (DsrE family)
MKLAILLTSGVESEDARTVRKLTEAALKLGHQVGIFFMDDGVFLLDSMKDLAGAGAGAELVVCAHNCYEWGVGKVEGVLFGGQNDWAEMVHDAERVVVFG